MFTLTIALCLSSLGQIDQYTPAQREFIANHYLSGRAPRGNKAFDQLKEGKLFATKRMDDLLITYLMLSVLHAVAMIFQFYLLPPPIKNIDLSIQTQNTFLRCYVCMVIGAPITFGLISANITRVNIPELVIPTGVSIVCSFLPVAYMVCRKQMRVTVT